MSVSPPRPPEASRAVGLATSPSLHWSAATGWTSLDEPLADEAPLAIEIAYERNRQPVRKVLAVTMRTPGHDEELALGFLLAEGLIVRLGDVAALTTHDENARGESIPTQRVQLNTAPRENLERISRGPVTSSACGLCSRPSLDGLPLRPVTRDSRSPRLAPGLIEQLPAILRREQPLFSVTGGTHGAALCDPSGRLRFAREDVGRHNAVDKLVGAALRARIAFQDTLLVLSGRASFELVQKAAAAGIPVIAAVGAPSSLAVTLAHQAGLTLIGFTRPGRFNAYTHADRLALDVPASLHAPRTSPRTGAGSRSHCHIMDDNSSPVFRDNVI